MTTKNFFLNIFQNTKSKIIDLAIRGKIVPQDPNDEPASVLLECIKAEHTDSKKKTKNISLLFIPPYSPELNPAECIWRYIKTYTANKVF